MEHPETSVQEPNWRERVMSALPATAEVACMQCPARTSDLCRGVKNSDLEDLFSSSSRIMLRPEETLIIEGDEAQTVYNVISGTMRLTRLSSDGRRQILTFLFTGNFVGLTPDASYHFNAEAVSEVELCAFDRKRLETLFRLHPEMQKNFHHMTAKMIDAAHDLVFTLGRKTAIERLATFLLFLRDAENVRGDSASPLSVPMTRLDIADFLGLTIETVSRGFSKLKADGIIKLPNAHSVEIARLDRLRAAAGQDQG